MNPLSEALRDLMDRQKLTGAKLAKEIGLSATSVSQILTGKTKPRQVTLSRLMKVLCDSPQDKQALLSAYESLGEAKIPTTPVLDDEQNAVTITRSSAVEYLTFVAAQGEGGVEAVYADEDIWLSQKMMAALYDVDVRTANYHLKKIFSDNELQEDAVIRKFRITAADGKSYEIGHYNLSAIIAVGYKVNSERAVQFRKWATGVVKEYTVKGFAMDDERLKEGGTVLNKQYFEEQLQRIREIRLSERKFYQKITDIYRTAIDYDLSATATKRFFATVQNKLHWAIQGQTAAEMIVDRADAGKQQMGLTTWKDAPDGKIQKFDVSVAKNYLSESEMAQLSRLVNAYLDIAEDMAQREIPMTMQDWETRLNRFIEATDREILQDAGKVTAEIAKAHAESEFEKYRIVQDRLFESDFDREVKRIQGDSGEDAR